MKILSRFTDYYDYVEYLYSPEGGDPENVYNRVITESRIQVKGNIPIYLQPAPLIGKKRGYSGWHDFPWRYKWCVVCGRLYLLVRDGASNPVDRFGQDSTRGDLSGFKLITENHPSWEKTGRRSWTNEKIVPRMYIGSENETCHRIAKQISAPVFIIHAFHNQNYIHSTGQYNYVVDLDPKVPNLGQLGFASIVSPERMYQEIAMYLPNLKENPDNQPPTKVSDKDRLVQKGFDSKVSFRGKLPK
jgi:hypothetical protein